MKVEPVAECGAGWHPAADWQSALAGRRTTGWQAGCQPVGNPPQDAILPQFHVAHPFGFNSPISIDANGCIIAGHGRNLAALQLGLETAPMIISITFSKIEKRAYLLADNKLTELSDGMTIRYRSRRSGLQRRRVAVADGRPGTPGYRPA